MNVNRRITASDVAKRAGVERSTVSRILNRAFDQHRYSEATVEAVREAAESLGYRPSSAGRALRLGRSMLIGLIVPDIANSFFGQIAAEIEAALRPRHYRVMMASTGEDPDAQKLLIQDMQHREIDGLILAPSTTAGLGARQLQTPTVLIDRPAKRSSLPYIGIDNHHAGRLLGEHLRELGYRRVAVVSPDSGGDPTLRWRLLGLRAGLGQAGRIVWANTTPLRLGADDRCQLSKRIAQTDGDTVDVIVGLTNDSTLLALEAVRDAGLTCPRDIGVCGIDDFRAAESVNPPLTVVAQPIPEIARAAVDGLLTMLRGEPLVSPAPLDPRLIQRSSLCYPTPSPLEA